MSTLSAVKNGEWFKLPNSRELVRNAIQIKNKLLRNALAETVGTFILLVSIITPYRKFNFNYSLLNFFY